MSKSPRDGLLFDGQWVNIVNANNCWRDYDPEAAVHEAVRMTLEAVRSNGAATLIAELGQEVGEADWNDWFVTWAKARGMTMQLTTDGRFMCPDTALAQGAHEAGCMVSHMYYMELCRQEEQAKTSPAHTSEARDAVTEADIVALVAGPYMYHHKMDEQAEREGKAFDRCRELTIQNIRTHFAMIAAMRQEGGNG